MLSALMLPLAAAAAVDVATGATIAKDKDNATSVVIPPSLTKDKDAYIDALVMFKGECIGAFVDGTRPLDNGNVTKSVAGVGGGGGG